MGPFANLISLDEEPVLPAKAKAPAVATSKMASKMAYATPAKPSVQGVYAKARAYADDAIAKLRALWAKHQPTTLLGYTTFAGAGLLAFAAALALLTVAAGLLLLLSWGGSFAFFTAVVVASGAFSVASVGVFVFAAVCAGFGAAVLAVAGVWHLGLYGIKHVTQTHPETRTARRVAVQEPVAYGARPTLPASTAAYYPASYGTSAQGGYQLPQKVY